jgi:predicted patatin/cPLA2 family phospholipase
MRRKLDTLPLPEPKIKGVVGYVDLTGGEIRYVSSLDTTKKEFLDHVQASCSIPFFMRTQRTGGEVRVDGGVRDILPLKNLIRDPMRVGEIHVIGLSPPAGDPRPKRVGGDIVSVVKRAVELLTNEIYRNDLKTARDVNRMLDLGVDLEDKRKLRIYEYFPEKEVCGDSLDFRAEVIRAGIDMGRAVAEAVLQGYKTVPA